MREAPAQYRLSPLCGQTGNAPGTRTRARTSSASQRAPFAIAAVRPEFAMPIWAGDARRLCRNRGRHQNDDHSRHEQDPTHEAPTMLCLCLLWRRRDNRHKERNVCDLLPERDRPQILVRIRGAWALSDHHLARERLGPLASELDRTWPDAAASLCEGIEDTLTLMRLGIDGQLFKDTVLDEPVRVDDRDRPLHTAQREALAGR